MPETRYIESKNAVTGIITQIPYIVTDAELAEEAEINDITALKDLLSQTWTLAQTQSILKKLLARLYKKGIIP